MSQDAVKLNNLPYYDTEMIANLLRENLFELRWCRLTQTTTSSGTIAVANTFQLVPFNVDYATSSSASHFSNSPDGVVTSLTSGVFEIYANASSRRPSGSSDFTFGLAKNGILLADSITTRTVNNIFHEAIMNYITNLDAGDTISIFVTTGGAVAFQIETMSLMLKRID